MQTIARDALISAQERQARHANTKRRDGSFEKGEEVLLSTKHLKMGHKNATKKLQNKFVGPFKIVRKASTVAFELGLPSTWRIHPVFHVSLLRRFRPDDDKDHLDPTMFEPDPVADEEAEYEVEAILDKRKVRCQVQYLVKWKGFPTYEASWEPLANLSGCQDLLERFERASPYDSTRS